MIDGLWNPRYYSDAVSEGQAIGPLTPNFRAPAENCRGFFISRNWTHALHRSIENQANVGSGSIASLRTGSKASPNVRYAFDSGRICASQRTDAMGPGCVKSRKFNLHLELPSLFRRFENEQCKQLSSRETTKKMVLRFFCRCDFSHRLGHNRTHAVQQTAFYSITSSARASSVVGIVMPNVLAVCRLMTSSNLVGSWTGISAGFSPLRMRPV
jgi:hypothetical protein